MYARGHISLAAKNLGLARTTFRDRLEKYARLTGVDLSQKLATGTVHGLRPDKRPLPRKGQVKRYLMTAAQNNTYVHDDFWDNLEAFAEHMDAELMVVQVTYNKASYGKKSVKPGKEPTEDDRAEMWYDPALSAHVIDKRVIVAPTLVLCGEMNIMPTASTPLTGFSTYAGSVSAVFPHMQIAMESTAVMRGEEVKLHYTTGACTLRNYIQKREGLRAEFHHAYGAALIEVDHHGDWWVRQINARDDGSFYDLDVFVNKGKVSTGHNIEAVNWGDVHWEEVDPVVAQINWAEGGILDTLRPKYQFMHDTIDFYARNHHRRDNPHAMFERWLQKRDGVREEMVRVAEFLSSVSYRSWCQTVVVDSNHDNALERWLREADYRLDPGNAEFFLDCQVLKYRAIRRQDKRFHLVQEVLRHLGVSEKIRFLQEDESFVLCRAHGGGIEFGQHGHLGPNGARGTPGSLSKVGRRANVGHFHSACIRQGLYVSGTCSKLDLEYTSGPSSWTNSHIITYPNGKRAIITIKNKKWRAG